MLKLHSITYGEYIIITSYVTKFDSDQYFHTWGKGKNGGDELPHAQWIIYNSKNKTVTHNTINNIYMSSYISIHIGIINV